MRIGRLWAGGILLTGVMASGALSQGPAMPPATDNAQGEADQQLVENTCSACHDIAVVKAQHLTADDWAMTVDKMVGLGARLPEGSRDRIIAYLAAHQGVQ
jgi:hypothetical protein